MRQLALAAALCPCRPVPARAEEIPGAQFECGQLGGRGLYRRPGRVLALLHHGQLSERPDLWIGLYPNDTLSILLRQPDVKFQPGQKFELWVMMETGMPAIGNGEAWDADYGGITYDGIDRPRRIS
jgi:hypothetical protein